MSREESIAIVKAVYEDFNRHDVAAAAALVSADFELDDVALGMTLHGPEGFRQWLSTWLTAAPDARTELLTVLADGDWVTTEHVGRGTHTGPLSTPGGEVPATGNPIELRFCELFEVRGGKIVRLRAYWDQATFLRQLGLMPAAAAA